MIKNFVTIDFETASGKNPCSIGLVEFINGKVVNEYHSLINPNIEKFNPFAVRVHGIKRKDVINEKEFDAVWNEVKHFFENKIIIAHNATFDLAVLNYSLERYDLIKPSFSYYCTLKISRKLLVLNNYKLNTLADYYGIKQHNYHNALEDAYVCGELFKQLSLEVDCVDSFLQNSLTRITEPTSTVTTAVVSRKVSQKDTKFFKLLKVKEEEFIDLRFRLQQNFGVKTDKLKGQVIVVSGVFHSVSRTELKKLIEDNGGKVSSSISSKTSYIVAGDNMGPSKRDKAEKLNIELITEQDFLNNLD